MAEQSVVKELSEPRVGDSVPLPAPRSEGPMSLEETLAQRRSVRSFSRQSLTLDMISQLLWAAQGVSDRSGHRTAPSAGACYPLETYLVSQEGVFRYRPDGHTLEKTRGDDLRRPLAGAALGQEFVAAAAVSIVFTAVYERTTGRYGDRGARYVHMDAGHAAQNIHLQAEALGLASVAVGAFEDSSVARGLGLPSNEHPIYIIAVGARARS